MDDLISRHAAINALHGIAHRFEDPEDWCILEGEAEFVVSKLPSAEPEYTIEMQESDIDEAMKLVRDARLTILPPAQPEQRWIPVKERLPDELAEVNITWVNTDPEPYYEFIKGKPFTGTAVYFKGKWFWYSSICKDYLAEYGFSPNDEMDDAIKVIAWCELPEPYKEET